MLVQSNSSHKNQLESDDVGCMVLVPGAGPHILGRSQTPHPYHTPEPEEQSQLDPSGVKGQGSPP